MRTWTLIESLPAPGWGELSGLETDLRQRDVAAGPHALGGDARREHGAHLHSSQCPSDSSVCLGVQGFGLHPEMAHVCPLVWGFSDPRSLCLTSNTRSTWSMTAERTYSIIESNCGPQCCSQAVTITSKAVPPCQCQNPCTRAPKTKPSIRIEQTFKSSWQLIVQNLQPHMPIHL